MRHTYLSSVGRMDLSARSVEDMAAIGFTDVGSMSANSAIVKVQLQWELCCTAPTFR